MSDSNDVVYEFESGRDTIRASVSSYRGRLYADLRKWYEPSPGEPLRPTPKGVNVLVDQLPELKAAIAAIEARLPPNRGEAA